MFPVGAIRESPAFPWYDGRFVNRPYGFAKNLYRTAIVYTAKKQPKA